jgi:hyperosmotically inducible periplasmic protein
MKKTYRVVAMTLLSILVAFWSMVGQAQQETPQEPQQEGVATKAAEKLDDVGRAIKKGILNAEETVRDGLNKTGETVREGFAKTRDSVQGMGILSRVYGRVHWDKALHSSSILVKAEGGSITIRGMVPDEATKAKAIDLVKDTVGVTRVIDQLSVLPSSAAATSRPAQR